MNEEFGDKAESEASENDWLATFADICLLLLIFFILLFSLSTIDPTKFMNSFGAIKGAMGGKASLSPANEGKGDVGKLAEEVKIRMEMLEAQKQSFNEIRSFLVEQGVAGQISAVLDEGVITLRLGANVLFGQFDDTMAPESTKTLDVLTAILVKKREQNVDIRGYTDNQEPPEGLRFRDNWELSALRSVAVLRYLLANGIESTRLTATGFADLNPLLPNTTPENRARNRRVEFVLERTVKKGK